MKKAAFSVILVMIALTLFSCTGTTGNAANGDYEKYYTGTRGVVTTFDNLNPRYYYYGPTDVSNNPIQFGVNIENKGASFTRGGIYVSGFDPRMIQFQEFNVPNTPSAGCSLSIGSIGWGNLGGIFSCDGVRIGSDGHTTTVDIKNLGSFLNDIGTRFSDKTWFDAKTLNAGIHFDNVNGNNFQMNFNSGANIEYYQHGRLFIALLSALDFRQNGGLDFLLAGNTYDFPGGEKAYFTYNGKVVDWPAGLDQTTQHLLLTSCYQYTTYADPMICMDPDPLSSSRKVCTPQSRTWGGGNGAPVQITSIEQENTPLKVIFHINVKNVGTGIVYDPGQLEKCSPYYPGRVSAQDQNVVYLGDVRIGQNGIRSTSNLAGMVCNPTVIRLDASTKTGSTTCTYPMDYANIKSAYTTPLIIELWYGYSETVQRDVVIKRVV